MVWDYIIVGQGLAGSMLSYHLIKNHYKVLVFDDPDGLKSSMVAAGIYNPFTGRKLVKTWLAEPLFDYLEKFYPLLEEEFGVRLLHSIPMYRPFLSLEEQNEWGTRSYEAGYRQFIDRIILPAEAFPQVHNPFGGMMLKRCGYVDIPALIEVIRKFLESWNSLKLERFDQQQLEVFDNHVKYRGVKARRLVFCEGPSLGKNQFFHWLPLKPVKGEILKVKIRESLKFIVNRGIFILPISPDYCRVGATFDHKDLSWTSTYNGKQQLVQKLDKLIRIPYQIVGQTAGVRPASLDRRPLIGLHPEYEPLAVFNGLGTKGVSLAPYFSWQLFEFLERERPLIEDVSINRYFYLYYNKF